MRNLASLSKRSTSGFTLVEILVVIAIIGILAAIAIPAINSAYTTAKEAAIRQEINVLSQAMETYKLEHGDYPPDFSSWDAVERHFRKAFPNINNNELRILAQFTHYSPAFLRMGDASAPAGSGSTNDPRVASNYDHYPHAIDRAEALVFCLGGYSKDKKYPFTGQGGPLVLISGATLPSTPSASDYTLFQFNTERETGFYDFDITQLSVTLITGTPTFAYSDDEGAAIGSTATNALSFTYHPDPFPVYHPPSSELPIVYFSSRSYDLAWGAEIATSWNSSGSYPNSDHFQNIYLPAGTFAETGVARPYASNVVDTTPPTTISGLTVTGTTLKFAEDGKFQLISAGLDSNYGGIVASSYGSASAGISVFPSGEYYNPLMTSPFSPSGPYSSVSSVNRFQDDLCLKTHYASAAVYRFQPQLDNVTNFTTRTFESDLP